MKKLIDIKRFKLYMWIGIAFLVLGVITNYAEKPKFFFTTITE
jgi:hypothetical protein